MLFRIVAETDVDVDANVDAAILSGDPRSEACERDLEMLPGEAGPVLFALRSCSLAFSSDSQRARCKANWTLASPFELWRVCVFV